MVCAENSIRHGQPNLEIKPQGGTLWTHALKRTCVRYRNPYQTRHTYAFMMLSADEPPCWVADQMGHSDLSMIFRRYGRWQPDTNPDAGNAAVEIFGMKNGSSDK